MIPTGNLITINEAPRGGRNSRDCALHWVCWGNKDGADCWGVEGIGNGAVVPTLHSVVCARGVDVSSVFGEGVDLEDKGTNPKWLLLGSQTVSNVSIRFHWFSPIQEPTIAINLSEEIVYNRMLSVHKPGSLPLGFLSFRSIFKDLLQRNCWKLTRGPRNISNNAHFGKPAYLRFWVCNVTHVNSFQSQAKNKLWPKDLRLHLVLKVLPNVTSLLRNHSTTLDRKSVV